MINIIDDMLAKYSDTEIIEYLDREVASITREMSASLEGDNIWRFTTMAPRVNHVSQVLRKMNKRNQERIAKQ